MIDRVEHFFRRLRRWFSRSELLIPLLGLSVSKGTSEEPGLILLQIDGLSRKQMERAMERGRLPFLRRLIQREHYETRTFYSGLPASTPAVQGELYYGERCAVPSFSMFDRESRRLLTMFQRECVGNVEAGLAKKSEGLLSGGSSWSNIYSGGASPDDTHLCFVSLGFRSVFHSRPILEFLTFPLLHFPSLVKIFGLLVVEFFIALWDMFRGLFRGESVFMELRMVLARVFICIGLREIITIGAKVDAMRGLPIIHLNFLGYDEQAHRRGPSSLFAHWSLKGIDRAIKNIYRAAQRSSRRDYQVWIFSDHGQEATRFYDRERGETLEETIQSTLNGLESKAGTRAKRHAEMPARVHWSGRGADPKRAAESEEPPFAVAAMGPVGHLYLKDRPDAEKKRELAKRLLAAGIPGVLICEDQKVEWFNSRGSFTTEARALDFLPHPDWLKAKLAEDFSPLCQQRMAGDLVLLGWSPDSPPLSFVNERGAHAGPGLEETQGFVLLPALTRLPDHVTEFLRPSNLRAAALHYLKRQRLTQRLRSARSVTKRLRVMTYNVHSCRGMDGRISPRRIARVIEHYNPDVVALQELDFGRVRSQRHDQPRLIAEELGMHLSFCPTVIDAGEQYGHAVLSHFPLDVIRTEILESGKRKSHVEPRGALWVRLSVDGLSLNFMNTHFGLRRNERLAQAGDLLSENWIGGISEDQPMILCGDFNMFPRSRPYRALTRRLRDVQNGADDVPALNTFATLHPFARIDHIFVSHHFMPQKILVPRTHLTRVASDHLPLVVDLEWREM
jgi:endonuclease/exonuclease/phosphatase family metal-dependent hydrolase